MAPDSPNSLPLRLRVLQKLRGLAESIRSSSNPLLTMEAKRVKELGTGNSSQVPPKDPIAQIDPSLQFGLSSFLE